MSEKKLPFTPVYPEKNNIEFFETSNIERSIKKQIEQKIDEEIERYKLAIHLLYIKNGYCLTWHELGKSLHVDGQMLRKFCARSRNFSKATADKLRIALDAFENL